MFAGAFVDKARQLVLPAAGAGAVCSASAFVLLVRLQRSLRVVKRSSKLVAKQVDDDLCSFEAKLSRPIPQHSAEELAQQLSGCAKGRRDKLSVRSHVFGRAGIGTKTAMHQTLWMVH